MRRFCAYLLFGAGLVSPAGAQVMPYQNVGSAQHGLSVSSATALSPPATAGYATICARGAAINYTTDGTTTPTSSVGQILGSGLCVGLPGTLLKNFSAIGSGATLDVEYFR